ncbi:MAG: hypothetical protein Q7R41_10410 [Phycisphaerales bacterium]|nr:hypothetical protein [Phycisphaerales bacterium]
MNNSSSAAVAASPRDATPAPIGERIADAPRPPGPVVVVRRGAATWSVPAGDSERLLGNSAPDWFALESSPCATCVKSGHHRSTWRVALDGGRTVFAKVFDDRGVSVAALWRRWTHNTPAEREWRVMLALRARKTPVTQPLALGFSETPLRRFVLLAEGINGATNLTQAWSARRIATLYPLECVQKPLSPVGGEGRVRGSSDALLERSSANKLIGAVARLWASSHDCGFAHPDGHPANVLVFTLPTGDPAAMFVDVAGGLRRIPSPRASEPVSTRHAIRSLAQLDQYFHRTATRSQRLRFWRRYWSLREKSADIAAILGRRVRPGRTISAERRLLCRLFDESAVHAAALARQRDRRLRRNGKYFARLAFGDGWHATVTQQLERRHLFPEPHVPDRTAEQWRELLRSLVESSVSRERIAADPTIRCVRCPSQGTFASVIRSLVGSPARRVFERCHQLRHRDIAAPLALAYLERRSPLGLVRESFLVVPESGRK